LDEVEQEIMKMPKGKSPGPNDFTIDLFKAYWSLIKQDI